jgi:hypothetical protein
MITMTEGLLHELVNGSASLYQVRFFSKQIFKQNFGESANEGIVSKWDCFLQLVT